MQAYLDLLRVIEEQGVIENVAPIQLGIRLLIPEGSRMLELEEVRRLVGPFDPKLLVYPWNHPNPEVDALAARIFRPVHARQREGRTRAQIFGEICEAVEIIPENFRLLPRAAIPYLDEPWYC